MCESICPGCNCQYGISSVLLGIVVEFAAGVFFLLGVLLDWNGIEWYHLVNMLFFALGGIMLIGGTFYEVCVICRCKPCVENIFAREPELLAKEGEEQAPTPYIMIA